MATPSEVKNPLKIETIILKSFIKMNEELNPINLEDIKIKRDSVASKGKIWFELYIIARSGQNTVDGTAAILITPFNRPVDLISLFGAKLR